VNAKAGLVQINFTNDTTAPHNVSLEHSGEFEYGATLTIRNGETTSFLSPAPARGISRMRAPGSRKYRPGNGKRLGGGNRTSSRGVALVVVGIVGLGSLTAGAARTTREPAPRLIAGLAATLRNSPPLGGTG
jgi:hypothetical protein